MRFGRLFWLIWLIVFFLELVATSSPSKKSAKRATRPKQAAQWSEKKKRTSTRDVTSKRAAYGDGGEQGLREDQLEDEEVERRGFDQYGTILTDTQLDTYVDVAIEKLIQIETSATDLEVEAQLKDAVGAVETMADLYGLSNQTLILARKRSLGDSEMDRAEDESDDEAEWTRRDVERSLKAKDRRRLRAARETLAQRSTMDYTGFGTVLYFTIKNVTLSKCSNLCKADSICDSYLLIVNSGLCILHEDVGF